MTNRIRPCGYYVLVKVEEVESKTEGGIVLPDSLVEKEQATVQTGQVINFGPTVFIGMRGIEERDIASTGKHPAELWGVRIGDKVEFRKYEGKPSAVPGMEDYRYIPDTHIIGVIHE